LRPPFPGTFVLHRAIHQQAEIDRLGLQADLAARDARDLEQVVDETREVADLAVHQLAHACDRGIVRTASLQQLDCVPDRARADS
jgi:hypothetical protein